uniref:ATP synthase complex subunit 8 n=1 Tax=Mileewa amplimacula TaxID=2545674 RepID=A0A977XTA9_9HEMI|nr:ATP synthase F0 subunit 8 [Mileewa amplimacula]UXX17569.1 ATP synthase F0 subunit 8 [Mileewa amplimacula]
MPQMSPIWWFSLMIMTIFMLMLINNLIYFNILNISIKKKETTTSKNNWKW